jgi:FKBP-type peptidyl-prolyl cis-trans isomerase
MATSKSQRIGIWIIAITLTVGTLAGFIAIILAPSNQQADQAHLTQLNTDYQNAYKDYLSKLSVKYFDTFNKYSTTPAVFIATDVTELKTEDLVVGTGTEVTANSSFVAYYIGWTPDGKVFDSSIDGTSLKAPLTASPGSVISGWTEGATGMKEGGVRELTIPSDKAYGATGSGTSIAPNTPLKFIIMLIPATETTTAPQIPAELLKYYANQSS